MIVVVLWVFNPVGEPRLLHLLKKLPGSNVCYIDVLKFCCAITYRTAVTSVFIDPLLSGEQSRLTVFQTSLKFVLS